MPQPIWPTCIAFRHKLQSIIQAEINACHLGYARSMRTMHHVYVPPCFLQQSPSLSFFASHPSYVNCTIFLFFFFLFQSITQLFSLYIFYSPVWKHSLEDSWFSTIRKSTIIFITPPSWNVNIFYPARRLTSSFPLDSISNLHNPCRLP